MNCLHEKFVDGYAIHSEVIHYNERGEEISYSGSTEDWSVLKYNIIDINHHKQLAVDYDKIELLFSKTKHFFLIGRFEVGLLSSNLQEIIPVGFTRIEVDNNSDIIRAAKQSYSSEPTLVQYINYDGIVLRSIIDYDNNLYKSNFTFWEELNNSFPFFKNDYCVISNGIYKGVIDTEGKYVIPPIYNKLQVINENQVIACKSSKFGLISMNEVLLLNFIFDRLEFIGENRFIVRQDNCEGILNLLCPDRLILKSLKYHSFSDGAVLVSIKNEIGKEKFGFEDYDGEEIVPLLYNYLSKFENGIAVASINKKYGLINQKNQVIQSFVYDNIYRTGNGYFLIILNNKVGLVNADGSILLKARFENIVFKDDKFLVELKDCYNYLNLNGKFANEWMYNDYESATTEDTDDMYLDALDGNYDAAWNID